MSRQSLKPSGLMSVPARNLVNYTLKSSTPDLIKFLADLTLIVVAALAAWFVCFSQVREPGSPWPFVSTVVAARLFLYGILRLHRLSWLHVSRYEVLWLALTAVLGAPLTAVLLYVLPLPFTLRQLVRPASIFITEPAFYLLLLCGARITARAIANSCPGRGRRVLIVGAGATGRALAYQIQESVNDYQIVGFVDDDTRMQGRRLRGLPIVGKSADLPQLIGYYEAQEIVVAIPSLAPQRLRELLLCLEPSRVPIRILPPLHGIMGGTADYKALRELRMEDLLPRPEIALDRASINSYLSGKTVLVTGGGGSIGGELCRQALLANATRLLVLGRGENSVFEMINELAELNNTCVLVPIICDVRDRRAVERVFQTHQPDVVFHAAAHKHVPLMEQYPSEAVKNNILGTLNIVQTAVAHKVECLVMVSTDKAVDPSSVMGATKRIGELIVRGYANASGANMVSVRFGNVLGSRGSVVPTMTRQILQGKPVTITDPDMVRYFMTIPEAVQLILQAGSVGGRGEVFVLDMGRPVRILDLAHDLIRLAGLVPDVDIPIHIIGRRPGEKISEDLLTSLESKSASKTEHFYTTRGQTVELPLLEGRIEQLRVASEAGQDAEVIKIMQLMLPDFRPGKTPIALDKVIMAPDFGARLAHNNVGSETPHSVKAL